ncbi:unnamed protein product, partial [Bubo scandiacus]
MAICGPSRQCGGPAVRVLVLAAAWALGGGQVRYSVPEEAKAGTVVGRLAQDLGLEAGEAEARRLRLVAQGRRASVEVSGASGALVVSSRLDREELCGKSAPCALRLEVLVERPLRVFHVELEVTDINDNAPLFPAARRNLSIAEFTTLPGSRFPLEGASDADIGANAQLSYTLSPSEHFSLDLQKSNDRNIIPDLVLTKALDRETVPVHRLVVTASDGGRPSLTGTMELVVSVLDANDNAPQFNQSVYKVQLPESAAEGTLVARVNATDPDEGINSEVTYTATNFIPLSGRDVIAVNAKTGEIRLTGALDYEEVSVFDFRIEARDRGSPPLSGHCSVELEVLDVNDNAPEVWVTSLSVPVSEDAPVGTVVALLSVSDRDSGANGRVRCAVVAKIRAVDADSGYNAWLRYELWEPRGKGPFRVGLYSGEVSTARALEEADGPRQRLVIVVRDHGEPARSATATLSVSLVEGAEAALAAAGSSSSSSSGSGLRAAEGGPAAAAAAAATNVWLVVAICAVSSLFLLAVVLYGASRWAPRAAVLSGPGPATLVCASEVGSWSYSQRQSRSLCVADGAGKSDLMVFSPNFPPPPGPAAKETQPEPPALLDT